MVARSFSVVSLALFLASCGGEEAAAPSVPEADVPALEAVEQPSRETSVRYVFASPEEGAAVLTRRDSYTENVQPREAGIRARDVSATSFADYAASYEEDVQTFTEAERQALEKVV